MVRNFPTVHSHPQSLDSASTPEAFAEREIELGTGVITVTDHGTLAACRKVYNLAKSKNLTPVLGIEGYFRDDDCPIFKAAGIQKNEDGKFSDYLKYAHLTIHFMDQQAYEAGVRLLSKADLRAERHGQERKPLFDWRDLEELGSYNTTMTSGCLIGMVQRHLLDNNDPRMGLKYYEKLRSMVKPGNFYVEVFPHICDRNWVNGVFITLEDNTKLKYYDKKKLRTDVGEVEADRLAIEFNRKGNKHQALLAVNNYRVWEELQPKKIVKVEKIEDFIPNPCRPWAPNGDLQAGCNRFVIGLAQQHGDKIVIGDDSHFATPAEKPVQDVRLMAGGGSWRFANSYHRQSSAEAFDYFKNQMGISERDFENWVDNAYEWSERFKDFKFTSIPSLPTKFYPTNTLEHLGTLIIKHGRMDWGNPKYVTRLNAEIQLLHYNGIIDLLPYFFLGEDACSVYEQAGLITGPGRGSAAGLLLTYLLGITHVDPLKYDLSMDRFLTLDRIKSGKLPDIDFDFPQRDLLVDPETGWLKKRFGDHYAQISVDTTLKLRSSVKDVARVFHKRVPDDIEALTKKFQNAPQGVSDHNFVFGYEDGENWVKGSIEYDKALQEYIKKYPNEWKLVQKCLGLSRQKGRHASAFIIANQPIDTFIPLVTISDVRCTQYTAEAVEASGGLKMDFLVINSLNDISDCIKLVQQRSGVEIPDHINVNGKKVSRVRILPHNGKLLDIWDLPEDQQVFRDVAEGKTETVFQFNTSGAVKWLTHFNHETGDGRKAIDSVNAMAAFTALDRPGPLDIKVVAPGGNAEGHNMLVEYARRARGEIPAKTLEVFNRLLPETYGVMVYQEQLQKVYQDLTGCTGAEAEEFRTNVAKKKKEKIIKAYPHFMEKAGEKIGKESAQEAWDFIQTWAAYGFNKSHAVCYATIGYACAYLKHHFPLEWWCAVLRNADKNEVNEKFWKHCGYLIDLPDVKLSGNNFEIQGNKIRAPISLLHGVGETAHNQLNAWRPYVDITDFCQKMKQHRENTKKTDKNGKTRLGHNALNRKIVYTLVVSGAMNSLFPPGTLILDQLMAFEEALATTIEKKRKPILPQYQDLSQLTIYQMQKSILPVYTKWLLPCFVDLGVPGIVDEQNSIVYKQVMGVKEEPKTFPFVRAPFFEYLALPSEEGEIRPDYKQNVAVPAYVLSQKIFNWSDRENCELVLDIEGFQYKAVKWGHAGKLSPLFKDDLKGAVIIALLSKREDWKPFSIESIVIVKQPLDHSEEESPTEE